MPGVDPPEPHVPGSVNHFGDRRMPQPMGPGNFPDRVGNLSDQSPDGRPSQPGTAAVGVQGNKQRRYVALMFTACSGEMGPGAASVEVATIMGRSRAADDQVGKGTVERDWYPPGRPPFAFHVGPI